MIAVKRCARMEQWQGRGLLVNTWEDPLKTTCAHPMDLLRKNIALEFAHLLFNSFALTTKTICAAKEMVIAKRCRAPARRIMTARVPLLVAVTAVTGLRGSTAASMHSR